MVGFSPPSLVSLPLMHPAKVRRDHLHQLTDLPNIGPASAADLRRLGIHHPKDLIGKNADTLYHTLCALDGIHHDPCVLDVLQSVVDYMHGGEALPWWTYSAKRKQKEPGNAS